MEGLRLVKFETVQSAGLVSVGVGFSGPAGAVPKLPVGRVARCKFVTGGMHLQFIMSIELLVDTTFTPVGTVMCNEG